MRVGQAYVVLSYRLAGAQQPPWCAPASSLCCSFKAFLHFMHTTDVLQQLCLGCRLRPASFRRGGWCSGAMSTTAALVRRAVPTSDVYFLRLSAHPLASKSGCRHGEGLCVWHSMVRLASSCLLGFCVAGLWFVWLQVGFSYCGFDSLRPVGSRRKVGLWEGGGGFELEGLMLGSACTLAVCYLILCKGRCVVAECCTTLRQGLSVAACKACQWDLQTGDLLTRDFLVFLFSPRILVSSNQLDPGAVQPAGVRL